MVRAKFRVQAIKEMASWQNAEHTMSEVQLNAVADEANKTWARYTPGGEFKITIDNPEALKAFKLGQCYFVDFTEAPAKESEEKASG